MSDQPDCLSDEQLWAYVQGLLSPDDLRAVERHCARCASCRHRHVSLESTRKYSPEQDEPCVVRPVPDEPSDLSTLAQPPRDADDPTDAYDTARFLASKFLQPTNTPGALGKLNEYDVFSILGHGGYGIVFEAHDTVLNRRVALKVLTPDLSHQTVSRRRFIREARAAAAINHPNVVTIYGVDEAGAQPFLVMEMLRGKSLRERLRREPKLDLLDILRIGIQISQGLAAAHSQGIIHRDVKPGNVLMVDDAPRVKLTDFGLARVATESVDFTSGVVAAGTPGYMSPEQVRGEELDTRSDLFALGCVLYSMFSGHSPFHGRTVIDIARRIDSIEPPRLREIDPAIPEFMDELVYRLLRKQPDDRFQSAAEVADTLNRHLAILNQTPTDRLPAAVQRQLMTSAPPNHRSKVMVGVGAALLFVVVVAGAAVKFLPSRDPAPLGPTTTPPSSTHNSSSTQNSTAGAESNAPPSTSPAATAPLIIDDSPVPATTIRVSRGGSGDFRTIAEALAAVKPSGEIRVIDNATYDEAFVIDDSARFAGVTIRATRGAILRSSAATPSVVIQNVPNLEFAGFIVETPQKRWSFEIRGECPGLKLVDLTIRRHPNADGTGASVAAIVLHAGAAGAPETPLALRRIRMENANVGLVIGATAVTQPTARHIVVEECRIDGMDREKSTLLALLPGCEDVILRRNVFSRGLMGTSLVSQDGRPFRGILFDHNSWFDIASWIVWSGPAPTSEASLRFHDNLVVDVKFVASEMRELALADVSNFRGNLAVHSDGSTADALAPCALLQAEFPLQSVDPSAPNFLHPDFAKMADKTDQFPLLPGAFTNATP